MRIRFVPIAFAVATLSLAAPLAQTDRSHSKLTFSESYRFESKTTNDMNSSETESVSVTKWTIQAEIPLSALGNATLGPDTPFSIKVGGFRFDGALKDDPKYRAGDKSARLVLAQPVNKGASQQIIATAQLNWDRDKMKVKVETKSLGASSISAADFTHNLPGSIKGETTASIQIDGHSEDLKVPFSGRLNRKAVDTGFISGEAVTIDIKGNSEDVRG